METIYGKLNKQIESVYYTPINTDTATITIDKDLKTIKVDVNVDFILKDIKEDISNIEAELSNKLDKLTTSQYPGLIVYSRDIEGNNVGINARPSIQYGGYNIIYRDANARAEIETPIEAKQIANKEYVDNTIAKVSVEKQSISGDALDIIYGATRNVGFDFSKRTPILEKANITAANEVIEAMTNNETILGLMDKNFQTGTIHGGYIVSFTYDATSIQFVSGQGNAGIAVKFHVKQGVRYYIKNLTGTNINNSPFVVWSKENDIIYNDFSHGWVSSITGIAFVLINPSVALNSSTINRFEIVTDDEQVVFELTDKSKPNTVVKRNSNGNIDEVEQLTKVMPTDINIDSNNYLILEHDGTEITKQKKQVKFFDNTTRDKIKQINDLMTYNAVEATLKLGSNLNVGHLYVETSIDIRNTSKTKSSYIELPFSDYGFMFYSDNRGVANLILKDSTKSNILLDTNVKTINSTSIYGDGDISIPVVSANPTTTGTEETLKAIKVGDTSYQLPNANGDIAVEIEALETAKNGTLTAEQLATLQANETNYIMFNHEKYYLMDKGHTEGYLTYTHVGYENNQQWIKAITITISTLAWVLNVTGVEKERHHVTIKGTGQASSSLTKSYLFRFDIYLDKGVSLGTSINSLCSALGPSKFTVNGFFTADDVVNNITEFVIPQAVPGGAPSTYPYVLYGPEDTESTHFNEFSTTVTDEIYDK